MTRIRLVFVVLFALLVLTACNTIEGMGKDIKSAGDAIEDAGNN